MTSAATGPDGNGVPLAPASMGWRALLGRVRLLYQPVIRLADMKPTKVEVLARTLERDGTLAGPETLLAAMDSGAASMALTEEILRQGLIEQAKHELGDGLCFVFNLPLDAMLHPDMLIRVEATRAAVRPRGLMDFELTERHPVRDIGELSRMLGELLAIGYYVALDDVTPDTPNLDALVELPFRTIKLDCSVVSTAGDAHTAFIAKIVAGAARRGQAVVAEGIETLATLRRMRKLGVSHGQGFYFARPMPAADLREFLSGWQELKTP